jgi:hypothetical protein
VIQLKKKPNKLSRNKKRKRRVNSKPNSKVARYWLIPEMKLSTTQLEEKR